MGPVAPKRSALALCFIGSNIVALGAGTPYLYSFYAPQLLKKCQLPVSQLSTLPLSLNIGSALLGFLAGVVIDRNVKASCFIGAVCTFLAYSILDYCYTHESSNLWLLCFGLALVGYGSVSGFYAAVKCCTTNFPHHRGTAGAFPVALYALAGMVFSYFCAKYYGDDIDKVFKFLAVVCSSMIFVGCLTLRILVEPTHNKPRRKKSGALRGSSAPNTPRQATQPIPIQGERSDQQFYNDSGRDTPSRSSSSSLASSFQSLLSGRRSASFLWSKELTGSLSFWGWGKVRDTEAENAMQLSSAGTLSHSRGPSYSSLGLPAERRESYPNKNRADSFIREDADVANNITNLEPPANYNEDTEEVLEDAKRSFWRDSHVIQTIQTPRFIAYFFVLATLQGIGQTYIYSVGFIVRTQIASTPEGYETFNAEKIQSLQVSIISLLSFGGRLCAGPVSDLLIKKLKAQRLWNIVMAACLMIWAASQTLASSESSLTYFASSSAPANIKNISVCSAMFGFAFGILFGTFPSIIADSFGTGGFSTIWGLSTSGGLITVKLFSGIFGADLGRNTQPNRPYCDKGALCYRHTFHVIMLCSFFAMLITLGIIAVTHHHKKRKRLLDRELNISRYIL